MRKSVAGLATALILLVVSACGSSGSDDKSSAGSPATGKSGKKGGTATVLNVAGGVAGLDPGYWYYQTDYQDLFQPTQRALYGWKPEDVERPTPDLAVDYPKIADGGKTLTIKIKPGIKYSPPLQDRAVTSKDVKYAIERTFLPQVANGYAALYYAEIAGVKDFQAGKAKEISGIQAPDDQTLVLKLNRPQGVLATGVALGLAGTIPVPKDYAQKYDKGKQSTYGQHQVFTGPYMVPSDSSGKLTGYTPGKELRLVRNPSWDAKTDFKPAYLDKIVITEGNDATVVSRKILSGQSLLNGDFAAPPTAILKSALKTNKDQLLIEPSQSLRFIALNTKVKPFGNANVRKAVAAVVNRNDLRTTRGGPTIGLIATHFIPPGIPGFEEAGGNAGPPGLDFNSKPDGDLKLAMEYMKKGGFPSGKYTGPPLLMVGDNQPPASKTAEAIQAQLGTLGFKFNFRQVQHPTMISKFCSVPKAKVAVCPSLAWGKDFTDAQSLIDPIYNGKGIVPVGNNNYAQLDDPKLNAMMDKAETIIDVKERAKAWGDIDKEVTAGAYIVPWLWDNSVNFASKNVNGVRSKFNSSWDLTFSSLK